MLPRARRLRASRDIQATIRRGRCLTTPALRLCARLNDAPVSRTACVVGKSVHKHAVQRHRYQRQLRELARHVLHELPAQPAYDMVLVAQPGIQDVTDWDTLVADTMPRVISFLASVKS